MNPSVITFTVVVKAPSVALDTRGGGHWLAVAKTSEMEHASQAFSRLRHLFEKREGSSVAVIAQNSNMPGMQKCVGMSGDAEPPLLRTVARLDQEQTERFWAHIDLMEKAIAAKAPDVQQFARTIAAERAVDRGFAIAMIIMVLVPSSYIFFDVARVFLNRILGGGY